MRTALVLLFVVAASLAGIPFFLLCVLTGWQRGVIAYGKGAVAVIRRLLGVPISVRGADPSGLPSPAVFMANHVSLLDGPLLGWRIPRPVRIIMKTGVFRIPVVGWMMRFVGFVPVDRKGADGGRRAIDRAARLVREKGWSFLVFPEGTRSRDGRLQAFRRGGFFLSVLSGAPVVPVSVRGTYAMMPRGSRTIGRGRIEIVYHEPIAPGSGPEALPELMEKTRAAIASGLGIGGTAA